MAGGFRTGHPPARPAQQQQAEQAAAGREHTARQQWRSGQKPARTCIVCCLLGVILRGKSPMWACLSFAASKERAIISKSGTAVVGSTSIICGQG